MNDRASQCQALLPSAGERLRHAFSERAYICKLDYLFLAPVLVFFRELIYAAVKIYIFFNCKVIVEREFLRHVTDMLLYLFLLVVYIESAYGAVAGSGRDDAAEHPYRRRFARAVGAEESEYLAFLYLKVDLIDCGKIPEPLLQLLHAYSYFIYCHKYL